MKEKFPNYFKWTYKKWYFWVIVIAYSVWSEFESYVNFYVGEIIGSLGSCLLIVSLVFLLPYLIIKHSYKKPKDT